MIGMSVCSGIGAPERAAPWIDWKYQSEIEKFPSAVLAERFPDATNLGDMTKFKEWPNAHIDVLCGGTPCQSFSISGQRKGLADPRGNLALTYLAIADRYRPRWLVWENVPGVLSALSHEAPDPCPPEIDLDRNDGPRDGETVVVTDEYRSVENHALWCFMAGAAELGYHGGFIHLDAQYVQTQEFPRAVPQRRERLFFVGYIGDWRRAAAVLFEREGLSWDPPPSRKKGQSVAATIASSTGGVSGKDDQEGRLVAFDSKGTEVQFSEDGEAPTLRSMGHLRSSQNAGGQLAVAFDTTQITSAVNYRCPNFGDPCHPLAAGAHPPTVAFDLRGRDVGAQFEGPHDTANIRASSGGSSRSYVPQPWVVRRLTPTECERLMGFPDGWTQIPWRNKDAEHCPDGPRYKALGNSWAVNCGEYIFDQIRKVDALCLA